MGARKKIGVLLSGCGVFDGSEIHEAVLCLLSIRRAGADYLCLAPDADQLHVVDHRSGEPAQGTRNILDESARIARGEIRPVAEVDVSELDGLVIPGGFGAAKNLCDYAVKGRDFTVRDDVRILVEKLQEDGKPIGAACIAPVLLARIFGGKGVELTIGSDEKTAADIESTGAKHVDCGAEDYHLDSRLNILSTPAYMCAGAIEEAAVGIDGMVKKLVELA